MTDRELLELAARAAGIKWPQKLTSAQIQIEGMRPWNPLTDPGDALRLAAQLGIDLTLHGCVFKHPYAHAEISPTYAINGDNWFEEESREELGIDPLAATMRAITRAAAEIGKGMEQTDELP